MPWKPSVEGEVPTLGWYAIDWMTSMLARPALGYYEPFVPYREQEDFILRWYELDPATCRFRYQRGLYGRPRGHGKSPLLAAFAALEGLGEIVPAGWDAKGQPVGRPWSDFKTPLVRIGAVSEEQTRNTWQPLLEMLREGPVVDEYPGLEPLDSVVNLPRGQIRQITSSARTEKGAPMTFGVLDQTEEWVPSNGGRRLAQTMRTNAAKNGGRTVESPNAYLPGEGSVAEESASTWADIRSGRARDEDGLLYDHREAPAETDMADHESLVLGLRVAYGDSSGHVDGCVIHEPSCPPGHVRLEPLIRTIWDPATDVQMARSDFLNQITHASDSWLSKPEWDARMDLDKVIADGDSVTLGFDGSRGRARGKADATALVGCRVSDGHLFEIRVWEQPTGPVGRDWLTPVLEVEAAVQAAFDRWRVVAFYADPSGWAPQVAEWDAKFGRKLKVKATTKSPIAVWPLGKGAHVAEHVNRLHQAVVGGEMTHDGGPSLSRHVINARRRPTRNGYLLYKAFPESPDKVDAAYAAVMAWKSRLDAVAARVGSERTRSRVMVMS